MKRHLTLGSLFDGAGGFPLCGMLAGIKPVWASEIEPFAIRVTTKRLPFMKQYGDIQSMNGAKIEPVDVITASSPCQDMSVAGKREGLDGSRSRLFYEAIRIIKEMRKATNGEYPKYIVWENVPGALSSGKPKGADFHTVLTEVCRICDDAVDVPYADKWQNAGEIVGNGYSVAWRILDAQYWGVPQRRKRIYLVGDLTGWRAGSILFESEGLSGYSAEGFRSWQRATRSLENRADTADVYYLNTQGQSGVDITPGDMEHANMMNIHQPKVYGICADKSNSMLSDNPNSGIYEAETTRTLDANGGNPACNQGGMIVLEGNGSRPSHLGDGYAESETMYTLNTIEHHGVAYGIGRDALNQGQNARYKPSLAEEVQPTLVATGAGAVAEAVSLDPQTKATGFDGQYIVRRLTPTECARLQGFPDWWCDGLGIENPTVADVAYWREVFETFNNAMRTGVKTKTDKQIVKWLQNPYGRAAEYKLWGNSIAIPCGYYVLSGIAWDADCRGECHG